MADGTPNAMALAGKRIVVTRPAHQSAELAGLLETHGAEALRIPAVEIQAPARFDELDEALRHLRRYEWLIFTSVNGVESVFRRADDLGLRTPGSGAHGNAFEEDLRRLRVCVIGPATRAAAEAAGLQVDLMPTEYVAESLVEAFQAVELSGKRVLLPRAAIARDVAPESLRARGALVDVVEAYRSGVPVASQEEIQRLAEAGAVVDWVTFTSSSTVKNFLAMGGAMLLNAARTASIGPVTSETLTKHGWQVDAEAVEYTVPGLVEAILQAEESSRVPHDKLKH